MLRMEIALFLVLCAVLLFGNWRSLDRKKRFVIGAALVIEFTVCALQGLHHTWLISGMGLTLMTLALYLTLENPDILRGELTEQKLSMLYLKSQVNPHFLYNTLDAIRIQAQLDGDKPVADLLMRLVDFFRLSVKVDRPMVTLDDELELLEAYLELMCVRYPELQCDYDVDPELGGAQVPNFILQPIVENSLLHGLKNKGYRGRVAIAARKLDGGAMEVTVCDSGSGFAPGKRAEIDAMLANYAHQAPKLTGNSIGILNVQKRDRRDVYSDVAALPPRRRAVRNGARVISESAISPGSRPLSGCLFIFWFRWKNNECSPLFWVYLRQKGGDHYDWDQKSRQIHGAAPQGADRLSARAGCQPDAGAERGAERDAVLL